MRALLDTSVILAGGRLQDVEGAISVITVAELRYGILREQPEPERHRRQARLARVQQHYAPLLVGQDTAEAWAQLAAHTASRGRQPRRRAMDLLIAATAQAHGLPLLTLDDDLLRLGDVLDVRRP